MEKPDTKRKIVADWKQNKISLVEGVRRLCALGYEVISCWEYLENI